MTEVKIGKKTLGGSNPCYIIAEFGVNHNGSLERAKEAVIKAAKAGADAIKFQTYTADELVVKGTPKFWNFEDDADKDQHEAYQAIGGFPLENYIEIKKLCDELGIEFMSTPFSIKGADFLNSIGMKAFKIASSDLSYHQFLRHIARFNKPILLSTGAATLGEIDEAVRVIQEEGNNQIVILHCTLCYPTMYPDRNVHYEDANLNLLKVFKDTFPDCQIGISDHTQTAFSSIIAYALGASVVEKHYTVDKTLGFSADHWFSVDPKELKEIVDGCRNIDILRGSSVKKVFECEKETRKLDKRSIVSKVNIKKGQKITEDMLTCKRPGTGIFPKLMDVIVGKVAQKDIPEDSIIQWEDLMVSS
jgi:sialic acid synthase SpsE